MKYFLTKASFLFYVLGMALPLHANISQTFRPSINSAGTRFVNGTWDYITTPYLYGILEKNALSMLYVGPSNALRTEGYNIGFRIDPMIIPIPIHTALSIKNSKFDNISREASPPNSQQADREEKLRKTNNMRINAILGLKLPFVNAGLYIQSSKNKRTIIKIEEEQGTTTEVSRAVESRAHLELYETKYGIEFGSSEKSLKWAWACSIDYRDFDQPYDDQKSGGSNDAPLFDFNVLDASGIGREFNENAVTVAIQNNMGAPRLGFSRKEVGLNFLGWYSDVNTKGNIGMDFVSYYIPTVSGTNSTSSRLASLTGYKIQPTLFYDYDFSLDDNDKSTLRLTPATRFTFHSEKAKIGEALIGDDAADTAGFEIDINETEIELIFGIKMVYYLIPSLQLYFSYLPAFTLYHLRKESLSTVEVPNQIKHSVFSNDLTAVNLGMSYQPSERLSMNFDVYSESDTGEFHISRFRVGLDFLFF